MENTYVLLIDCPDEKGLVYKITGALYNHGLNVVNNDEFVDKENNHFFMRTELSGEVNKEYLVRALKAVLSSDANIKLTQKENKNIVVLGTKEHHCLGDLLIRHNYGELNANILAVISNYEELNTLVSKFDLPYHCVSHIDKTREQQEKEIAEIIDKYNPEYIVLAKYMRILSADFVEKYKGRIINIHHSFLPAFIGASPYKQAFERGVKIIGATAHFVNNNLDEGPIIMQNVVHIDHTYEVSDIIKAGRDVEKLVLYKALEIVFEDRIFITGNKTIVFN